MLLPVIPGLHSFFLDALSRRLPNVSLTSHLVFLKVELISIV